MLKDESAYSSYLLPKCSHFVFPLLSFKQGEGSFGIVWERFLLMAYSRAPHGVLEGAEASFR